MNKEILVVIIETQLGVRQELYPGNVSVEEKGAYTRILEKPDKNILGLYPTARIVGARFFNKDELVQMANQAAAQQEPVPPIGQDNEALHPSDGSEERQDSPDR